jgi:GT2 family glycosyltransferase
MTCASACQADVIILSWNRPDDTIAAIASALEQDGVERRVLVVDQGSEPANYARVERFAAAHGDVELQRLADNAGVAGGRNIAAAMGSGRYIVALDSDAVFADRGCLARAVAYLDANPQLCAVGFRIVNFFTGENDNTSWDYPGRDPDEGFAATRFIGAGHAIRRSAFEAAGGYDARLFFCSEEVDLCYRMLNMGGRIEYLPDITVFHKVSPDQRVFWERGRYYYTVRNALYTGYKFGTPVPRLAVGALAFLVKGAYNRIPGSALRGLGAAIRLCLAYARSTEDKKLYRLTDETWRYIRSCEPWRADPALTKIRRQLRRLPGRP